MPRNNKPKSRCVSVMPLVYHSAHRSCACQLVSGSCGSRIAPWQAGLAGGSLKLSPNSKPLARPTGIETVRAPNHRQPALQVCRHFDKRATLLTATSSDLAKLSKAGLLLASSPSPPFPPTAKRTTHEGIAPSCKEWAPYTKLTFVTVCGNLGAVPKRMCIRVANVVVSREFKDVIGPQLR